MPLFSPRRYRHVSERRDTYSQTCRVTSIHKQDQRSSNVSGRLGLIGWWYSLSSVSDKG